MEGRLGKEAALEVKGKVNLCRSCWGTAIGHLIPSHGSVWDFYTFTETAYSEGHKQQICLRCLQPYAVAVTLEPT